MPFLISLLGFLNHSKSDAMKKLTILFSFFICFLTLPALSGGSDASAAKTFVYCNGNASDGVTSCSAQATEALCVAVPGCDPDYTVTADANDNAFVDTLCGTLKIVTGNGGKTFAAFAIISIGIGFFTGKVSWGLMIGVTAGIAAMFGAPTIVSAIAGGDTFDCSS